jgi:hypothetical protein
MNNAASIRKTGLLLIPLIAAAGGCDNGRAPDPAPQQPASAPAPAAQPAAAPAVVQAAAPAAPLEDSPQALAMLQPQGTPPAEPQEGARRRRRPPSEQPPAPKLMVKKVSSLAGALDAGDPAWAGASALEVPLQPQSVANPMLETATVQSIHIAALTDGKQIAWRLTWPDDQPAISSETGQFSDAVGIQFPLVPGAAYTMGAPDMPVRALYWRAQWQHEIVGGFQDVHARYPNAWCDLYWFAVPTETHYAVPASFSDPRSRQWMIGLSAGNPMSEIDRTSPIEETTAEGFGTLTHAPGGIADGRGAWRDGQWNVVIQRPIADDALSRLFAAGSQSEFAVAVWDGEAGNVAGRKHHSLWVAFEVEQ